MKIQEKWFPNASPIAAQPNEDKTKRFPNAPPIVVGFMISKNKVSPVNFMSWHMQSGAQYCVNLTKLRAETILFAMCTSLSIWYISKRPDHYVNVIRNFYHDIGTTKSVLTWTIYWLYNLRKLQKSDNILPNAKCSSQNLQKRTMLTHVGDTLNPFW